ncbi:MAG TPA: DUF1343 domain-containing protein [Balneolales bacterium]|nr:DUF1343 domain-containing protein [Balneolales bacterium]
MKRRFVFLILGVLGFVFTAKKDFAESAKYRSFKTDTANVKVGAQVLLNKYLSQLKGKRVGLVMNPTARVDGVHMLDTLLSLGIHITALYAPEHGFRGQRGAGETIRGGVDKATGLPVYSLYGKTRKPTGKMLKNVDLLLFDMQDVGARFYTYISTLGLVLEAASDHTIPVWVLDRPDPAGGNYVAGWMLHKKFKSFVGEYPLPMAYGMTIGELARMMVGEHWLKTSDKPKLRVIPCENYKRSMRWPQLGLAWYPPSPNLPRYKNALVYLGTCLFEGTTISEGRGTNSPFLTIGSPYITLKQTEIDSLMDIYNVHLKRISFIPKSIPGKSLHPKYENKVCHGVKISLTTDEIDHFDPVSFGHSLLKLMLHHSTKDHIKPYLYKLTGTRKIDQYLQSTVNENPDSLWQTGVEIFEKKRQKYLIYKN